MMRMRVRRLARFDEAGIDYFVDLTEEYEEPSYRHLLPARSTHVRSAIADTWVPDHAAQMQQILSEFGRRSRGIAVSTCTAAPASDVPGSSSDAFGGRRAGRQIGPQTAESPVAAKRARGLLAQGAADSARKPTTFGAG